MAKGDRRIPLFWSTVIWLAVTWLALVYGLPYLAMWVTGRGQPLPVPGAAMVMYVIVALVGALLYITISDESIQEFLGPVVAFLRGPDPCAPRFRVKRLTRLALLILLPLGAGGLVYSQAAPRVQSPTLLRIQHPTIPGAFERLSNPFREPSDEMVKKWIAEKTFAGSLEEARRVFLEQVLDEGRVIYQINCRPCHGDQPDGQGPMAWGFRLKPANFTDPGTIATVVESYAFWRVTEGGPGLPPEGSPWDSAMPIWKHDLTEAERWKVVLAAYDLAGVEPRRPERLEALRSPLYPLASALPIAQPFQMARAWGQVKPTGTPEASEGGKAIYVKRCLACHGERGDGQGPVAEFLNPRPRDFVTAAYRFRTTQSGEAPTDEDLFRVVSQGIPGTAMSGWTTLSEAERRQVISYLKTFNQEKFGQPPQMPEIAKADVKGSADSIAKGQKVYRKAKCWECHGDEGRGDGPSAGQLKTDEGFVIRAADLTKGRRYKGGREARDIFLRFTTGLDGTPMPSFSDAIPEEERWTLAHYVRSLQREEPGGEVVMRAHRVKSELPTDPSASDWLKAKPLTIPLSGQVLAKPRWENHSVDAVTLRALYNTEAIAFLLEWNDPFRDTLHQPGPDPEIKASTYAKIDLQKEHAEKLRDAIRLQFPVTIPTGPERPHFFLGNPGRLVNLWHWKADLNEEPGRMTAVEEENAEGFQRPVATQPPEGQEVVGKGAWEKGRWRVIMTRSLVGKDKAKDISFEAGRLIPFAIQAWDGSNGEKGLMMSLSSWNFVVLEVATPMTVYAYSAFGLLGVSMVERWLIRRVRRGGRGRRFPN